MKNKVVLTKQNIPEYLLSREPFEEFNEDDFYVEEITENTNVNFVFRICIKGDDRSRVYIKQAFDFVKVAPKFPALLSRQKYEKISIEYLQGIWGGKIPEVIDYDSENDVLIISDVGEGTLVLADEMKTGNYHFVIAKDLGSFMAKLHSSTFSMQEYPIRRVKANKVHTDFILDFRLGPARKMMSKETDAIFSESMERKKSLIYGDWATKNILVIGPEIRLVDFENMVHFDPAFDIGYALAHWVLELNSTNSEEMLDFIRSFEVAYVSVWNEGMEEEVVGIMNRAAKYVGAMMFHRFAGVKNTNRMEEYLSREDELIAIAKHFMLSDYSTPSEALSALNS